MYKDHWFYLYLICISERTQEYLTYTFAASILVGGNHASREWGKPTIIRRLQRTIQGRARKDMLRQHQY